MAPQRRPSGPSEGAVVRALDYITRPQAQLRTASAEVADAASDYHPILASDNVVAVGVAEKIAGKNRPTGELALTFYVKKKIANKKKIPGDEFIPPSVHPELTGDAPVLTDVVELGEIRPEINAVHNPIQPGNSIGHAGENAAGTLGAIVTPRRGRGRCLVLSNSHVLAKSGRARRGDGTVYPGRLDGGRVPQDVIAKLARWSVWRRGGAFVNKVDAAVSTIVPTRTKDINAVIRGRILISGTTAPKRGMKVWKVGRTTGFTTGTIRDIHFRFVLNYGAGVGQVGYTDQILVTRFTRPGDSGSLVVDQLTKKAVGLHFAGANGGSVSNPIDAVLSGMGVQLAKVKNPCAGKTPARGKKRGNAG